MTFLSLLFGAVLCALLRGTLTRTVEGVGDVEPLGKLVTMVNDSEFVEGAVQGLKEVMGRDSSGDLNGRVAQVPVSIPSDDNSTMDLEEGSREGEEGRHFKRKKMMLRMMMWLKTLGLGVVLPSAVALALFAAWKGITLSLLALLLAGIVGLKGLVVSASKSSSGGAHHVVLSGVPSHHQHYWRRNEAVTDWGDPSHRIAYRAYT